jgi:stage II sporulation protein D
MRTFLFPAPWTISLKYCRALMLAGLCLSVWRPADALAEQRLRIAVGRFHSPMSVNGPKLEIFGDDGTRLSNQGPAVLAPGADGILLNGKPISQALLRVRSEGLLNIRGHQYRNQVEVSWRSYRGRPELLVVHPIALETYVVGIVSSELPKKWPYEAIKAQAIAARTYAIWQKYRRLNLPYHMESTVLDQVYHGVEREHPEAVRAVKESHGIVLTHARRPIQAYFHSTCGGQTASAKEVWGNSLPYLPGNSCGFCKEAGLYKWNASFTRGEVDKALRRLLGEKVVDIRVKKSSATERVKSIEIRGVKKRRTIRGEDLRRLLGYSKLWSTKITKIDFGERKVAFSGYGAGHGVGMCQWGARGMAHASHSAEEILAKYYPGSRLDRLY